MTSFKKIFSFATVVLAVALTLSAISAWYSILGLTAIFAAAAIPIMIMGGALELAKVVTTVWLHRYWDRATWQLKIYLIPAVFALAFLTSLGVFGFLSKAHSEQTLVSGDIQSKIAVYDQKIQTAKENIAANRAALAQLNQAVDQTLSRTTDASGALSSVSIRRSQTVERTRINQEIQADQELIATLNEQSAPIRAEIRKVEAEVGPIKYIAAMIYGDNPDSNLLERAVRWVIILIVFVFDPLALVLVLAAQSSYRWIDEDQDTSRDKYSTSLLPAIDSEEKTINESSGTIQSNIAETNAIVGEHISNSYISDADEIDFSMDEEERRIDEVSKTQFIETAGITFPESENGYVQIGGKSVSKPALMELRPDLFAANAISSSSFGTEFPKIAKRNMMFIRTDSIPNRVFRFDGTTWNEISRTSTGYQYDEAYLKYLISKLETNEYPIELLSDVEKRQIEDYLKKQ